MVVLYQSYQEIRFRSTNIWVAYKIVFLGKRRLGKLSRYVGAPSDCSPNGPMGDVFVEERPTAVPRKSKNQQNIPGHYDNLRIY